MRLAPLLTFLLLALADDAVAKTRRAKRGLCRPQKPLLAPSQSNGNLGSTGQQQSGASLQSLGSVKVGGSAKQAVGSGGNGGVSGGSSSGLGNSLGSSLGSLGGGGGGGGSGSRSGGSGGGSSGTIAQPAKAPAIWSNSTGSTQSGQSNPAGSSGGSAVGSLGGSSGGSSSGGSSGGSDGGSSGGSGTVAGSATEGSANQTASGIGAVMSSSFTQYGAGDSFGSANCNSATAACGWYSNPGFNAAVSENLYGVGPGGGAGETCGKCYQLTATSDQAGKPLSGGGSIIVKVNNLCPKAGNPLCSQDGLGGTNQYGANVNFDICKDDGAAAHFFAGGVGMALGHAVEVDCGAWSGSSNLSS